MPGTTLSLRRPRASWCCRLTLRSSPKPSHLPLPAFRGKTHGVQFHSAVLQYTKKELHLPWFPHPPLAKLKPRQPCPLLQALCERKGRKPQGEQTLRFEEKERERKRYHCALKASRNVSIQFIRAYTRSGRAQDYCEENLGHIWSQQHSCHTLNGHVKQGLQQGPRFAREVFFFFFSVRCYNSPSLRCIFRQACEYIRSSIGVKDLAINPKNDSVSGISVGSFK